MEVEVDLAKPAPGLRTTEYRVKTDFETLALTDKDFAEIYNANGGHLNFNDPKTVKQVAKSLLKADFGLTLDVPDDRLCPPIPIRWNYVHWIQRLIESTNPDFSEGYDPYREVVGLDIGTGASAIYAMLMLRTRPGWTMCATDVDKKSLDSGAANLARNSLLSRSKILLTMPDDPVIPLKAFNVDKLDFVMCNPPFFTNKREMQDSVAGTSKSSGPHSICTGTETEMVCPGGDLGFANRMFEESLTLREKVTWYSVMFGKFESLKSFLHWLKDGDITNYAVRILATGGVTKRWVVAWSFTDLRPANEWARPDELGFMPLPNPTEQTFVFKPIKDEHGVSEVSNCINALLSSLKLSWNYDEVTKVGTGSCSRVVWNRRFRRRQQKRKEQEASTAKDAGAAETKDIEMKDMEMQVEGPVTLAFRVQISEYQVLVRWLKGNNYVLFESLVGFIFRAIREMKKKESDAVKEE